MHLTSDEVRWGHGGNPAVTLLQIFREMLKAELEGRPYSLPPPSAVPPPQRGGGGARPSSGTASGGSRNTTAALKGLDEWGNWDGDNGKVTS